MEMNRGLVFTTDAILAAGIIIALLSTITLLEFQKPKAQHQNLLMDLNATDGAMRVFYGGGSDTEPDTGTKVQCAIYYEYSNNGGLSEKVKKCAKA